MCQAECRESPLSRMGRGLSSWQAQLGNKPDLCLDVQEIKDVCGGCLEGGSCRGAAKLVPGETEYRAHSRSSTDDSPSSEDLPACACGRWGEFPCFFFPPAAQPGPTDGARGYQEVRLQTLRRLLTQGKRTYMLAATRDQAKPQALPGDSQEMGECAWSSEKSEGRRTFQNFTA